MSRSLTDPPERLLEGGATEFERRLLDAGARKGPSPEMLARMAQTIGVSGAMVGVAAVAKSLATEAAVAKATAGAGTGGGAGAGGGTGSGSTALLPWISMGALALVVAGTVVGTRLWKASPTESRSAPAAVTAPAAMAPSRSAPFSPAAVTDESPSEGAIPSRRSRTTASVSDVRDQIAVIDLARSAMNARDGRRALEILRRYQDKYPTGQFLPEAAALKIEAMVRLGRVAEARVLAERFVAENSGTMLADRVAELAGLSRP